MKLFIVADIEGIAGVTRPQQCQQGNAEYERARALMEGEVNAAIEGAFAGGAIRVVVADSHGSMSNLRAEEIHPSAELVQGKPREFSMAHGLEQDNFDGVAFVGLHSPASIPGILAHTINGRAFHRIEVNGQVVGESDLYADYAASLGVPLVMATGDDCFTQWIAQHHPGCSTVSVKTMQSTWSAQSLSPQASRERIREAMAEAVRQGKQAAQPALTPPLETHVSTTQPIYADGFAMLPGITLTAAQGVSFESRNMGEVIATLGALSLYSGALQ